jgi:ABC-type lipoprotein release transport system permease subunit
MVVEHAFTIGIGLLVAVLIAGVVWFSMSRTSTKNTVLENNSRVNEMTSEPQPEMPTQEQLEEMAKYSPPPQEQEGDNLTSE